MAKSKYITDTETTKIMKNMGMESISNENEHVSTLNKINKVHNTGTLLFVTKGLSYWKVGNKFYVTSINIIETISLFGKVSTLVYEELSKNDIQKHLDEEVKRFTKEIQSEEETIKLANSQINFIKKLQKELEKLNIDEM